MQNKFGEFLKKLRLDRNLTLRDVEEKAHISNAYLSQVERGERNIPTMKVLAKLATVYGVQVSLLNERAEAELKRLSEETFDSLSMGFSDPDPSMQKGMMDLLGVPPPDIAFISKIYKNLSTEGQQKVKDYLQFIAAQEKKK